MKILRSNFKVFAATTETSPTRTRLDRRVMVQAEAWCNNARSNNNTQDTGGQQTIHLNYIIDELFGITTFLDKNYRGRPHTRHRGTTNHPLELHHWRALRHHYILDKNYRGRPRTRHRWTTNHPLELHHWRALRHHYILDKNYRGRPQQWHDRRWTTSHLAT